MIRQGHMTKKAVAPIYGKNFSRTGIPMILKPSVQHQGLKLYKGYINWVVLDLFYSKGCLFIWMGKTSSYQFGKTCSHYANMSVQYTAIFHGC